MNIKKFTNPYKELPRAVYVLFFASIINNMGNFVTPLLTLFLTYKIGIGVTIVGVIIAINSVFGLVGSLIGGKLIDKIGRKIIFVVFRTISAIAICVCGFINSPQIIIGLIITSSLVSGIAMPVYSTIITDLTTGEKRKTAFSLEYMAMNIGMAVGPLLAAFLYNNYLRFLFIGDAITTIILVILVWLLVPETLPQREVGLELVAATKAEAGEEGSLFSALIKRPTIIVFSMIIVIYFVVFSQYNFGLSLQIGDIFSERSAVVYGTLMTINTVLCSIVPMFLVPLIKEIKPSLCIVVGGLLYAIGFGMLFTINGYIMFIVSTVLWTLGEILVSTNTNVYIASHTPITHRGRFNSIFPIIRKVGFIIGPMAGGAYIGGFGIRSLWLLIGGLAIIGAILMLGLYCKEEKNSLLQREKPIL